MVWGYFRFCLACFCEMAEVFQMISDDQMISSTCSAGVEVSSLQTKCHKNMFGFFLTFLVLQIPVVARTCRWCKVKQS